MKNGKRRDGYTEEVGAKVCEGLAEGLSLRAICKAEGLPSEVTIRRWAIDLEHPFSAQYVRAREVGYHKLADELLDIADDGTNDYVERENKDGSTFEAVDHDHIARSRLRVDARKWMLSKVLPKIYGDKVQVGGDAEHPINHEIRVTFVDPGTKQD